MLLVQAVMDLLVVLGEMRAVVVVAVALLVILP
jgi:hypothetical protein